ncbi:alpha/beta hydrolase [Streptomyces sp. BI20]|uniref:alpha/beta hydrolase n=1 Tax=Streptomyces sp. BI20 TaxID=3403460 RepID=UPI003C735422
MNDPALDETTVVPPHLLASAGAPAPVGPDRLDPGARAVVDALTGIFPDLGGAVTDAATARRILAAAPPSPVPPPPVGAVTERLVPGPAGAPPLRVRIYRPDSGRATGPRPTVVFLHGGGFVLCDLDTHDTTARRLCLAADAVVVSVDYRRAPEHPAPAAALDAYAALRWAGEHAADLGGDPGALVVAGDSAGANLAVAALLLAVEHGGPAVALQALAYPALTADLDLPAHRENAVGYYLTTAHMAWFWEQYLGAEGDPADPLISPLRAAPEALSALPPAHVVAAGCDPLRDDAVRWAERLRAGGVRAELDVRPGMFHGFLAVAGLLPAATEALAELGEAIAATVESRKNSRLTPGGAG